MKPAHASAWEAFVDNAKKFFVVNVKGYDTEKLTACTLLFEGEKAEMEAKHKEIMNISKRFMGMAGGAENGLRGYLLTYLIAYTRDLACQHGVAAESFETSCSWAQVSPMCIKVKQRMITAGAKIGIPEERIWCSFRVTQLYETGAAIYVYFTLYHKGMPEDKVMHAYEFIEDAARDEVMLCGGSISHHHGVGKIRKGFMHRTLSPMAIDWQKTIKDSIDPNNVFGINNTVWRSEAEKEKVVKKF